MRIKKRFGMSNLLRVVLVGVIVVMLSGIGFGFKFKFGFVDPSCNLDKQDTPDCCSGGDAGYDSDGVGPNKPFRKADTEDDNYLVGFNPSEKGKACTCEEKDDSSDDETDKDTDKRSDKHIDRCLNDKNLREFYIYCKEPGDGYNLVYTDIDCTREYSLNDIHSTEKFGDFSVYPWNSKLEGYKGGPGFRCFEGACKDGDEGKGWCETAGGTWYNDLKPEYRCCGDDGPNEVGKIFYSKEKDIIGVCVFNSKDKKFEIQETKESEEACKSAIATRKDEAGKPAFVVGIGCCGDDEKEYGKTQIDPNSKEQSAQYICIREKISDKSAKWSWGHIQSAEIEKDENRYKIKSIYHIQPYGVSFYDVIGAFDDKKGRWYACAAVPFLDPVRYFDGGTKFKIGNYGFLSKDAFAGAGAIVTREGNLLEGSKGTSIIDISTIRKENFKIGGEKHRPEKQTNQEIGVEPASDDPNRKTFICYRRGSAGVFEECCGDYAVCNSNALRAHIAGQPLDTVEEFLPTQEFTGIRSNFVLILGIKSDISEWYYTISQSIESRDLWLNNWNDFEELRFYLYYVKGLDGLKLIITDESGKEFHLTNIVKDYTSRETFRWYHVSIPILKITNIDRSKIKKLRFEFEPNLIKGQRPDVTSEIPGIGGEYYDLFVIDRLYLVPKKDKGKLFFCNRGREWVDTTEYSMDSDIMKSVCAAQPGHAWTGTRCCGEDKAESYSDPNPTSDGFACYKGVPIESGNLKENVEYSVQGKKKSTTLLNHKGQFFGCGLTDNDIEGLKFEIKGSGVKNAQFCQYFEGTDYSYFCGKNGFEKTDRQNPRNIEKSVDVNLIKNSGFEDGTFSWEIKESTKDTAIVVSNEKHTGSKSLRIKDKNSYFSQDIKLEQNKKYKGSFFIKGNCNEIQVLSEPAITITKIPQTTAVNSWQIYTFKIEGRALLDNFRIICNDDKPELFIDDIQIVDSSKDTNCCIKEECWSSEKCVGDGELIDSKQETNQRCTTGSWESAPKKFNPFGIYFGYCKENQCYGSIAQNKDHTKCLDSGTYIDENAQTDKGDFYCENGRWSSRTKQLGLKFLDIGEKTKQYTLFCEEENLALNIIGTIADIEKACVLTYDDKVAFGGVLPADADIPKAIKEALKEALGLSKEDLDKDIKFKDKCKEDVGIEFKKCRNNRLWYDDKLKLFIFNKDGIDLPRLLSKDQNIAEKLLEKLKSALAYFNIFQRDDSKVMENLQSQRFNRIYINKISGDKASEIFGVIETRDNIDYLAVTYNGFSTNICKDFVNKVSGLGCCAAKDSANKYFIRVTSSSDQNKDLNSHWQDLTAKLRVKEGKGLVKGLKEDKNKLVGNKNECNDGEDNDCDGLTDDKDSDCPKAK